MLVSKFLVHSMFESFFKLLYPLQLIQEYLSIEKNAFLRAFHKPLILCIDTDYYCF